jgi:hypothetical protein|tara:strand:+ start:789 stop:899 length:111 start_codon:yes stop_codon:yes gene_type:complete
MIKPLTKAMLIIGIFIIGVITAPLFMIFPREESLND